MLNNTPYYWGAVRKVVAAFGALFKDISIERVGSDGSVVQTLMVPITYAPKQRFYQMLENSGLDDNAARVNVVFPRMAYELTSLFYDSQRKLNTLNQTQGALVNGYRQVQYAPIPYNVTFALYLGVKNTEDGLRVIEQIIPFFQPSFNVSIWEMDSAGISRDIPIVLQNVDFDDSYDGDVKAERTVMWTLTFQASIWLHGPTKEALEIKQAAVNMAINNTVAVTSASVDTSGSIVVSTDERL